MKYLPYFSHFSAQIQTSSSSFSDQAHFSASRDTEHPKKATAYHKAFKQKDKVWVSNNQHRDNLPVFRIYAAQQHVHTQIPPTWVLSVHKAPQKPGCTQSSVLCSKSWICSLDPHPCPSHPDYQWDSLPVIRLSTGMSYLAGNLYLAAVLDEQSTPQAGSGCHDMMMTDFKNLILERNAQVWSSAITVKNVISNKVLNLSSSFDDKKHGKI